jgi:hypothetical protein
LQQGKCKNPRVGDMVMKYYLPQTTKGRDILAHIKTIDTEEDMGEFIHAYQNYLSLQIDKPEHDKRVIERTIFYMFGVMTGNGDKFPPERIQQWKKVLNKILYPQEVCEENSHRLLET